MRLLMFLYHAPPAQNVAALRARRLLRHLGAEGVDPVVVTPGPPAEAGTRFESMDEVTVPVTRFAGFDPLAAYQGARGGPASRGSGGGGPSRWKRVVRSFAVPDERAALRVPWANAGLHAAAEGVDAVYSTSSPYTAHLAARRAARALGVPWILEMRDLWADNDYLPQTGNPVARLAQERYERECVAAADRVVVLTEAHRKHLARRHPDRADRMRVVPNAFAPGPPRDPAAPADPLRLLYAGNLYGGRTLAALGRAVDRRNADAGSERFLLEVAGRSFDRPFAEVLAGDGAGRVLHGPVPHGEVRRLLAGVHAGVLHNPARDRIHVPGKLYDYLGAALPVLDLTAQPDVPALAEGIAPCWKVGENDEAGLAEALGRLAAWWKEHPEGAPLPGAGHPRAERAAARRLAEVVREVARVEAP